MPLRLKKRLFEKFPRHGWSRLICRHITFSSWSVVAGWHCPPVWILETHDDRKRDRPVLAGLSGGRRNRNTGDDGLEGIGGLGWRQNIWRCWYPSITGKWAVGELQSFRPGILESKEKRDNTYSKTLNAVWIKSDVYCLCIITDGFRGTYFYLFKPQGLMIPFWGLELVEGHQGQTPSSRYLAQWAGPTLSL